MQKKMAQLEGRKPEEPTSTVGEEQLSAVEVWNNNHASFNDALRASLVVPGPARFCRDGTAHNADHRSGDDSVAAGEATEE